MLIATGTGMSFIAAQRFSYLARAFGVSSVAYHAADWGHGQGSVRPEDCLIGFSYSGKTPETLEALIKTKLKREQKILLSSVNVESKHFRCIVNFAQPVEEFYPQKAFSQMCDAGDFVLETYCTLMDFPWQENYKAGHPHGVWGKK